ncbi:MAG: D-alanine--D-alanine ligase [bacterium]|nr:D-alanine--D-alanine ligase [bacterium]
MFKNAVDDSTLRRIINDFQKRARENFRKVAVLMGGESEEREISLKSGKAVSEALKKKGYNVTELIFPSSSLSSSSDFISEISKVDAVFVALHGKLGEDGTVQGLFEFTKINYTSPDSVVSSFFMDKAMTKLIQYLNHPKSFVVNKFDEIDFVFDKIKEFSFPVVVKPSFSGSSFGISVVSKIEDIKSALDKAFEYSSRAIIEDFLDGPEITVAVFQRKALGVMEILPKEDVIFSFDAKYRGSTEYIIPPRSVPEEACEYALYISQKICDDFLVDGAVRVDFKMKQGKVFFLELNTIPGMTERSLLPKIAKWRGIEFDDLVEAILGTASVKIHRR